MKICFNQNQISFSIDNIYLTSNLINGLFPDYKQIIPKNFTTEIIILKKDLLNALKIVNIFSDKFNQISLTASPKNKKLELYSKNSDFGENKTKINAVLEGEDVDLNFNYKYFLDCFQSINSDSLVLKLNESNKPMVITGVPDESFIYLIMPMNR
ncbi:MAG: polymerase III subunit beta protein [Candidatus Nomurabacteria bacterium GW2011_GWB1_37_5]|uniref:Polymerase III subunit beta protein n=1 Tax=Candidatus Nomurabacteria bacterium GW2011_GWB1_37_5 TaxID=1618742 RepID=A0A0G0GY14_9BACT|nr:MAG: polymerase III subunit beta protein [Candidatus Nomurabacteria bacterium GW2011_GWB1_37_5]